MLYGHIWEILLNQYKVSIQFIGLCLMVFIQWVLDGGDVIEQLCGHDLIVLGDDLIGL